MAFWKVERDMPSASPSLGGEEEEERERRLREEKMNVDRGDEERLGNPASESA